jgi:hypothetical protein
MVNLSDTSDLYIRSFGYRFIQVFRKRPDQVGKSQVEISKSAGEAWRSLTQEEKDVSLPFPSCLYLSTINLANLI